MNIVTDYMYPGWRAYDADSYDGATDSPAPITGYGKTEADAVEDLYERITEDMTKDDFIEVLDWAAQYVEEMFLVSDIKLRRVAILRTLAARLDSGRGADFLDTPSAHQPALVPLVGAETTGDLPASEGAAPTSSRSQE